MASCLTQPHNRHPELQISGLFNYLCVGREKNCDDFLFMLRGVLFSLLQEVTQNPVRWVNGTLLPEHRKLNRFSSNALTKKHTCQLTMKWKSIFTRKSSLSWKVLTKWKEGGQMETLLNPEVWCLTSHGPCNFYPVVPATLVPCVFTSLIYFAKLPIFTSSCWKEET